MEKNKQDEKSQWNYKRRRNEQGRKKDYPKDPQTSANGGLHSK
jgi:hypothetical protein